MRRSQAMEALLRRWVSSPSPRMQVRRMSASAESSSSSTVVPTSSSSSSRSLAKRFYKKAIVSAAADPHSGFFEVSLDHRVLRTPAKQPLRFTNPALALAIAAEWEWQDSNAVRSFTMPLMKLASISIDQIPKDKERVIETLLKYCRTDALSCRASPGSALHDKQCRFWDPLLEWVEGEIGTRPVASTSIFGASQSQQYIDAVESYLRSLNDWQLAAIDSLAGSAHSFVVALAIARNRVNIQEAIEIIRLEENHQVEDWGYVEGGHDIDEADILVRICAASMFLRLL